MTLLTLMSICSVAMPVFAQEIVFSDDDFIDEIVETEEEPYILSEDLTKREENVKHFLMSDGSYLAAQYDEPVHYENDNGEWIDYDNNLTKSEATETQEELFGQSTVYKTNNENTNIVFAEKSNSNTLVLIEDKEYPISWNYQSAKNSRIKVIEHNNALEGDDAFLTLDHIEKEVLYENFFSNIDLQYIVKPSGSKENIILKNKEAQNSFTVSYNIGDLTANVVDEKTIELTDGETVHYIISAPYMYDANGEISEDLTMTVTKNKNGKLKIELAADREWLDDENRAYPVVIDPSVSVSELDSVKGYFVSSQQSGAHQGDNNLKVGTGISNYGTTYALIKLDEITEDAFADHTVSAKLELPISTAATNSLRLYMYEITSDWSESSLSWNSMPIISTVVSDYANITSSSTEISFDISKLCTKWENDSSSNHGILIKTTDSGNLSFKIEHSEPILTYRYVRTTGIDSAYPYTEYDMGSAGTVYVNNFSGNLVLTRTDISTAGEEYPYTHSMTYNSFAVTESQESLWWPSYKAGFNLLYTHIDEYGTVENFKRELITGTDNTYTIEENQYGWEKIKLIDTIKVEFLFGKELHIPAKYDAWRYDGTEKCSFDENGLVSQTVDIEVASDGSESGGKVIFSREAATVSSGKCYHITDGDGEKIVVTIDGGNHTIEQVASANSGNDTVRYISDTNGNIVSITLNDVVQATFTYDSRNRMTSVTNNKGYKLTFEYDGNTNKISSVAESNGSVSGKKILIERSFNTAKVTTAGKDGILGNNNDLVTTYRFNSLTELVSESYSTKEEGNIGSVSYEYTDGDEDESIFGNISRVASVGKNVTNYLQNHNLESLDNWTPYRVDDSNCSYSAIATQAEKYQGESSVAVTVNDVTTTGGASVYQSFTPSSGELSAGEYIASAYVKTNGITRDPNADSTRNYGAAIMIRVATADGSSRYYSENIQKTDSTVDNGWERVFVTFEVPEDYTKVTMHLIVRNGTGTAYFDSVQIEDGSVPSQYNMLENNAFTHTNSSNQATVWTRYNLTSSDIVNSQGNMYIIGEPDTKKGVYQDINLGTASQSDTYVLGAWAKATALPKGSGRSFSVYPLVHYKDADGNIVKVQKPFSSFDVAYDEDMQYTSTSFDLSTDDETLVPYKIRILACYYRECNTAEFNSLSLIRTYDVEDYNNEDDGYTYDDDGKPLTYTDGAGNVYTYTYDNYGNLVSRLNQDNRGDRYTYSPRYNDKSYITSETYEDGTVTTYQYDLLFNLIGKTTVDGDTTYSYTYDSDGKILTESTTPGKSYTYTYDSYDNLLSKLTSDGAGDRYTYIYNNDKGYIATESFEDGSSCSYTYDSSYNLIKTTSVSEDGVTSVCDYDSNGNLTTQKDSRDGKEVTYYYNDEGKITKVNHNGFDYNYTFDAFGNPTAVKVGTQNLVTYSYQSDLSKLASMTYGNGDKVSYNYNNFGEVSRITMGDAADYYGFKHNANGDIIYERDTISGQRVYYQYDKEGTAIGERVYSTDVSHAYNNLLYSFADKFDDDGNLTKNVINVGGDDYSTSYSYTENEDESSTETTTISSSRKVIHNYDSNYNLISKNTTTTAPLNETFTYDDGNITQHVIGSDIYGYAYDDNGNITQITKNGTVRQSYVYDANNQLIRENNLDTNKTIIYTYDEGGNLLNKRRYDYSTAETPTGVSYNTGYAYDSVWKDKLVTYMGQSITYDAIGNPVNYMGATIDWFGRQMQSYSKGSTSITYKYDSDGLRTQKVVNGVRYDYYYVDGQLRYEKKGDEYEIIYRYNNDGTLASVTRNRFSDGKTDILYAVTNTRGDVIELRSGSGAVNTVYTYDSWGKLISITNASGTALASSNLGVQSSIRYRGYVYDTETGFYYLQSRYYDPEIGRFLNADDVDFIGASGTVISYNAFAYCENNAVNDNDFSGLLSTKKIKEYVKKIIEGFADFVSNLVKGVISDFVNLVKINKRKITVKCVLAAFAIDSIIEVCGIKIGGVMKACSNLLSFFSDIIEDKVISIFKKQIVPILINGSINKVLTGIRKGIWNVAIIVSKYAIGSINSAFLNVGLKDNKGNKKRFFAFDLYQILNMFSSPGNFICAFLDVFDGKTDNKITVNF